ncbi:MAG TPA: hypothetical protein VHL79_06550 [Ramlibacter sp.]|jgi:hypothetical protein|nr:hypothetical protein [Ramlibacter sp.]
MINCSMPVSVSVPPRPSSWVLLAPATSVEVKLTAVPLAEKS